MQNVIPEQIYCEVMGSGPALVLIHGWGLNGAVWQQIVPQLAQHFEVHIVDLPGFGHSHQLPISECLSDWTDAVVARIGKPAIYLGWSLGGLVATQAALRYPQQVIKLVTVASSPKFVECNSWNGIKPEVLALFQEQLNDDFAKTLARFLAIQAMGSESAKADIKALNQMLALRPMPSSQALKVGLTLLETVDLRQQLKSINVPFLRIYGRLDSLVGHRMVKQIDNLAPQSQSVVLAKSSHAPFISHPQQFLLSVVDFAR